MLDVGTLRVVTATRLLVLSGTFTSHSMSVRWHRHLRGRVSHGRFTVANVEGREINLHNKPLPCMTEIAPRDRHVTGAHATTCAIASFYSSTENISVKTYN